MASCFKCAVLEGTVGDVEAIGVCSRCNSMACVDHGTRLRRAAEFRCVLCLPADMFDSTGLVLHEAYRQRPSDDRGGGPAARTPAGPSPFGGGGGASASAFESSDDFERSAPRIAEAS